MKELPVKGSPKPALVDDEDFELASRYTWRLSKGSRRRTHYIISDFRDGPKIRKILLHRLVTRAKRGLIIDHKDRDTLNNQKDNLRPATNTQNLANCPGHTKSSSRFRGVSWDRKRKKWKVHLQDAGVNYILGRFSSEEEAGKAYDQKAKEVWGEFAFQNFRSESGIDKAT